MTTMNPSDLWSRLPVSLRAVVSGFLIVLVPINVWPVLLFKLGVPAATLVETIFLGLYVWWAAGSGPPVTTQGARARAFAGATFHRSNGSGAFLARWRLR